MLRLLGMLIVWSYAAVGGILLVVGPELGVRMLGLTLVTLGVVWLVLDVVRRSRAA
ncbi:hypothetical protein [Nocardioides sp. GY 10127]|uniref:hypothetical protein n=1 Tax=Nocardioides sp. GY 10127 TaxID=2569762 RepID=UPI0014584D2D|nr:hypothetical protein [Nocardioides sp. GY 10127]